MSIMYDTPTELHGPVLTHDLSISMLSLEVQERMRQVVRSVIKRYSPLGQVVFQIVIRPDQMIVLKPATTSSGIT